MIAIIFLCFCLQKPRVAGHQQRWLKLGDVFISGETSGDCWLNIGQRRFRQWMSAYHHTSKISYARGSRCYLLGISDMTSRSGGSADRCDDLHRLTGTDPRIVMRVNQLVDRLATPPDHQRSSKYQRINILNLWELRKAAMPCGNLLRPDGVFLLFPNFFAFFTTPHP